MDLTSAETTLVGLAQTLANSQTAPANSPSSAPSGQKRALSEDADSDASPPPMEGRRSAAIACDYCRGNHLKCNGAKHCSQCKKRDLVCVYPTPKKRGPKPGVNSKLKQQQLIIQGLTEEVEKQKHNAHEWRMKCLMSYHAPANRDDSVALIGNEDPTMYHPDVVAKYLDAFLKYVHPFFPSVYPPACALPNVMAWLQMEEERKKQQKTVYLQIHTVLAHGARKTGNTMHADMFIRRARHILRDLFDSPDYEVANGLCMLGVYYYGTGVDRQRASCYLALAIKMCELLNALENTLVGRVSLLVSAMLSERYDERVTLLHKIKQCNPTSLELLQVILVQVHTEVRHGSRISYADLLRFIEDAENLLKSSNLDQNDAIWLTFSLLIGGCRAGVFWNSGLKDFALDWALKTTKLTKSPNMKLCSGHTLMALDTLAQVHWEAKLLDLLADDILAMKTLSSVYSAAELSIRRFSALFSSANKPAELGTSSSQRPRKESEGAEGTASSRSGAPDPGAADSAEHLVELGVLNSTTPSISSLSTS